jgi:hypothetical protein
MIKAKEATIIAKAAELDESILNQVSAIIITRASKGKYFADITSIMAGVSSKNTYIEYFKSLGYSVYRLWNNCKGLYIMW